MSSRSPLLSNPFCLRISWHRRRPRPKAELYNRTCLERVIDTLFRSSAMTTSTPGSTTGTAAAITSATGAAPPALPPPPPLPPPPLPPSLSSSAAATTAMQKESSSLTDISASVQRSLALLHQLHCSVSSFTIPSQLVLLERLNNVMNELSVMHSAAEDCHLQIPIDVIRFIDEGRNPDEFTKDLIDSCIQRNQATKGKVDGFKALRKHLLEEIEDAYPQETEVYRALRNASAMESRRLSQGAALLANGDAKIKSEH